MKLRRFVIVGCAWISTFGYAQIGNPRIDRQTSSSKTQIGMALDESGPTAATTSSTDAPLVSFAVAEPAAMEPVRPVRFGSCEESADTRACKFHWAPALRQATQFLIIQHAMNMPTYHGTLKGPFFKDWFRSV